MNTTLLQQWTALGAGFNTTPASGAIDIERMLLRTAEAAPESARLFIMAASWLHRYAETVARHRLSRLIDDELNPRHRPALGLLLDTAQQGTFPLRFKSITDRVPPSGEPRPLFAAEQRTPALQGRAERRASDLSRRWNLWCEPIDLKPDAIRTPSWLFARHPQLLTQADFRGDLRASILASLRHDPGAGDSELALARASGGSRSQIRNALDNLELTGKVRRAPAERKHRVRINLEQAA